MNKLSEFYDANVEQEWLRLERHRTEFAVTMRALAEFLPSPPATVADVGGGPGRYALALADRYEVTLVDVSRAALEFARAGAKQRDIEISAYVQADARDLRQLKPASFDAVLLMGPLYHLLAEGDRRRAVEEAARVLRPGGIVFAAFVTRQAPIRHWAKEDPTRVSEDLGRYEHLLATGELPLARGFTFYAVAPADVKPFMEADGFSTEALVGCEGLVSMIEEKVNELTGEAWETWVELNYRLGKDPSLHGAAEHLLYVGHKS